MRATPTYSYDRLCLDETAKQVDDAEHVKVFATTDAAPRHFDFRSVLVSRHPQLRSEGLKRADRRSSALALAERQICDGGAKVVCLDHFFERTHRMPPLGSRTSPLYRGIKCTCTCIRLCPAARPTFTPMF